MATTKAKAAPVAAKKGKSLLEFKQAHDLDYIIPQKLKAAIASLGPDGWEYEAAIISASGISQGQIGQYRDQFAPFQVLAKTTKATGKSSSPKVIWCGSTAFAKKLGGPRTINEQV